MQVKNYKEPFYHSIITDFYTPSELEEVFVEIEDLIVHLSDTRDEGDPRSDNMKALHLDKVYKDNRGDSKILQYNRKIFELQEELKDNIFAEYLQMCNFDVTQLNYYHNGLYHEHKDHAVLSAVSLLHKEPKPYTGGELVFTDYRFTPDLQNNSVILFPSFMTHAVEPVLGSGRHSLNQFFFVHIG